MLTLDNFTKKEKDMAIKIIEKARQSEKDKDVRQECPFYDKCEDQICLLESNDKPIWYANEDICRNPKFKGTMITINKKKLKKKNAKGYFTKKMLSVNFVITRATEGIDPDVPLSIDDKGQAAVDNLYSKRENDWFEKHKPLSAETKKKYREQGKKRIAKIHANMEGN